MARISYARFSTTDQAPALQLDNRQRKRTYARITAELHRLANETTAALMALG